MFSLIEFWCDQNVIIENWTFILLNLSSSNERFFSLNYCATFASAVRWIIVYFDFKLHFWGFNFHIYISA